MKHAYSFAVKIPIAFPSMIIEIILRQHPSILLPSDVTSKKGSLLTFDYRLFVETHVPNIVLPTWKDAGISSSKEVVIAELKEVSKGLGETINTSTTRKISVDNLIN
jgi:hypothetical protein